MDKENENLLKSEKAPLTDYFDDPENTSKLENISNIQKPDKPRTLSINSIYSCTEIMTLNAIVEARGYSAYHLQTLFVVFLLISIEGYEITLYSSMLIPFQEFYHLDDFWLKLSSAIIFLGVGIGSYSIGYLTSLADRKKVLLVALCVIAVFHIAVIVTTNYIFFTLCRFIVGLAVGVELPLGLNIACESLPTTNRALGITLCWIGYPFAQVFGLLIMLIIMPDYDSSKVPLVLFIGWIAILITIILVLWLFNDSPRKLVLSRRDEEAYKVLCDLIHPYVFTKDDYLLVRYNTFKDSEAVEKQLSNIAQSGDQKENENVEDTKFQMLFSEKFFRSSVLIIIFCILCACIFYGPLLIISISLEYFEKHFSNNSKVPIYDDSGSNGSSVLVHNINIILMTVFSAPLGGILAEVKSLGRRYTIFICYVFSLLGNIWLILAPAYFEISQILILALGGTGYNVFIIYFSELYPTKIRDYASGLFFFINRFGGFLSQFIFLFLVSLNVYLPYLVLIVMQLICLVILCCLPYDTIGEDME